jgi:hypothetical protein
VLAVAALILAPLLVLGVVALILATKDHKEGKRLARPAQVIAVVALVVGLLIDGFLLLGLLSGGDDDQVRYRNLVVGDCIESAPENLRNVERVGCTESHQLEVVMVLDNPAPEGTPYPGKEALVEQASSTCSQALREYVGSGDSSELQEVDIVPLEGSWDDGNRRVVCAVGRTDGESMTTPLRG